MMHDESRIPAPLGRGVVKSFRLKDRNRPIPNGIGFYDQCTGYKAPDHSSFETQVAGVINARRANPGMTKRYNLSLDPDAVRNEVDVFLAKVCADHQWSDYIILGGLGGAADTLPFPKARAKGGPSPAGVVAGARTLVDMFGEDGPVNREQAEKRAKVCAACPLNEQGDWTRFFTVPAANVARQMVALVKMENLETTKDSELNVCVACGCPLKTKVWARIGHIMAHMPKEDFEDTVPECWIRKEAEEIKV